jgi:predicted nucleic acid-binding protein
MTIIADTGAMVALIDRSDRHHEAFRDLYDDEQTVWVLPWAILPEVDYLVGEHVGVRAQQAFLADLAEGAFRVSWGDEADLVAADRLTRKYRTLRLGLVDAVVITTATRLRAAAIATLDVRHFGVVDIPGRPKLFPRDA